MNYNINHIIEQLKPILGKHGIKKAGIFGSLARNEAVVNDIDLVVKIENRISLLKFITIQQELEDALGIKVDLVEYDALHPVIKDDIIKEEVPIL